MEITKRNLKKKHNKNCLLCGHGRGYVYVNVTQKSTYKIS